MEVKRFVLTIRWFGQRSNCEPKTNKQTKKRLIQLCDRIYASVRCQVRLYTKLTCTYGFVRPYLQSTAVYDSFLRVHLCTALSPKYTPVQHYLPSTPLYDSMSQVPLYDAFFRLRLYKSLTTTYVFACPHRAPF